MADVTVVVPVRDRHGELARCLAALAAHGHGGVGAVIVVDDGSADPAAVAAIAHAAGARCLRHAANRGPAAARNTGLAAATTPLVAFLDSDCVPADGWLPALVAHFADPAVGAAAPRIVAHPPAGAAVPRGWLAAYEAGHSALDMGATPSIVRPRSAVPYVPSAALVVRRDAAVGGFDEALRVGEDVDFVWRLAEHGWQVRYEPAAAVGHEHRDRLAPWFARRVAYGTSAAPLELRHPGTLPAVRLSGWSALAWAAAAVGPPVLGPLAGVGVTAGTTALFGRRLGTWMERPRPADAPRPGAWMEAWTEALRLGGGGTLAAGELLGRTLTRAWWPIAVPLAVAVPRARLPLAAAVAVPPVLAWRRASPDGHRRAHEGGRGAAVARPDVLSFAAARLLDDVAYSVGVWLGCVRHRTPAPLRASLTWRGMRDGRGNEGRTARRAAQR